MLCSCTFIDDPIHSVDPRLQPYIDQFFKEASKRGCDCYPQSLRAEIYPLVGGVNGKSFNMGPINTPPHIVIDEDYFNNASELQIERTVYHELGHALFNLEHTNNYGLMDSDGGAYSYESYEFRQSELDKLFKKRCS